MNARRITYLLALIGCVLWCLALLAAPFCVVRGGSAGVCGEGLYQFFRPICHQDPGRSILLAGKPLAVCARCSAVYFSFLVGTLLYPLVRRALRRMPEGRTLFLVALAPMLLDVLAGLVGLHPPTAATRLVTGALLGGVLPFVVLPVAIDGVSELAVRFSSARSHHQKG